MVRLATERDVYANLLRDPRGLRRDQSSARDTWFASLPWDRKEETLFELELLLKGIACYGNQRDHPGTPHGKSAVAQDFHEHMRVLREATHRVVALTKPYVLPDDVREALPTPFDPSLCPRCAGSFPAVFLAAIDTSRISDLVFGNGHIAADSVAPSFAAFAVPTVERWAVGADQSPRGRPEGLRAVGIGMFGTVVESLIAQHDGVYIDELIVGCPKSRCDLPTLDESFAADLRMDPPAPREGYSVAMSGAWRRLWLGGGVDASGTVLGDIWEYDLVHEIWRQFEVSHHPEFGQVLAIAWGSAHRALYVLSQLVEHGNRSIRLLRVDPSGNEFVVERTFAAHRDAVYELAVGPEDDMWIVSSRSHGSSATHSVMRLLRTTGGTGFFVRSFSEGQGSVVPGAVTADSRGLSVLLRTRDGVEPLGVPSGREGGHTGDADIGGRDRWF